MPLCRPRCAGLIGSRPERMIAVSRASFALLMLYLSLLCAANHYVRAGAAGSGDDWTNACGDLTGACSPSSMIRGDTYYVAGGAYCAGGCLFDGPEAGT